MAEDTDRCTNCGTDYDVEIEYCDSGEHCEGCCYDYPWCESQDDDEDDE